MVPTAINRVVVRRLFGTYNYDLCPSDKSESPDRLLILYGDNGSGKTTILKMLFHLLAPELGEGHKTRLEGIPFSSIDVHFTSGDHVWARRRKGKLAGGFKIGYRNAASKQYAAQLVPNERGVIKGGGPTNQFLTRLGELGVCLYFLSDDRAVRTAGLTGQASMLRSDEEAIVIEHVGPRIISHTRRSEPEARAQGLLVQSLRAAGQWIQSQAVRSASQGESSVNLLYGEILRRIAHLPLTLATDKSIAVKQLGERLAKLEARSRGFSRYGLQPEFTGKDILEIVRRAPPSHETVIATVLTPYLESVEKKLDAMERLQKQVDAVVRLVNTFYTRKQLTYEIHEGFRVATGDGRPLQPEMLSSGERHLLLLFCNTVQTLDRPSIFIIDEPEISLNIKWQRRLLSALLECAVDNPLQYIFATHSFELLAHYGNNAIRLTEELEKDGGPETHTRRTKLHVHAGA